VSDACYSSCCCCCSCCCYYYYLLLPNNLEWIRNQNQSPITGLDCEMAFFLPTPPFNSFVALRLAHTRSRAEPSRVNQPTNQPTNQSARRSKQQHTPTDRPTTPRKISLARERGGAVVEKSTAATRVGFPFHGRARFLCTSSAHYRHQTTPPPLLFSFSLSLSLSLHTHKQNRASNLAKKKKSNKGETSATTTTTTTTSPWFFCNYKLR